MLAEVSKAAAALIIVIYVLGFLVTSLYFATFGIPQLNPFKAQVLAAGVWASILLGGPTLLAHRLRPSSPTLNEVLRSVIWNYGLVWLLVSIAAQAIAFDNVGKMQPDVIMPVVLILALILLKRVERWERYSLVLAIIATILIFGTIIFSASHRYSVVIVSFWLSVWGQLACFGIQALREEKARIEYLVIVSVSLFLTAVGAFATTLYPRIQYSWGGGKPIPVLIYLSKTSDLLPGQQLRTRLVEQSDGGYYIIEEANHKALFIPNGAVSWVYYGEKPLDPRSLGK